MQIQAFKILIVDVDPEVLEYVSSILKAEGFNVIISCDSAKAIQIAKSELPQLILIDLLMPGLDGIEICMELRQDNNLKETLIALHTERNEDYSQIAAFNAGADDYIIKPVKPRVLITRFKALLKRHAILGGMVENKPVLGLIIDRDKYLIMKDGEEIILPRKEFELLALLSTSPKKVFTRKEISQLIWGYEFLSKNRTIDVHVRKIREKLGENYIKTIKGIGYRLEI